MGGKRCRIAQKDRKLSHRGDTISEPVGGKKNNSGKSPQIALCFAEQKGKAAILTGVTRAAESGKGASSTQETCIIKGQKKKGGIQGEEQLTS